MTEHLTLAELLEAVAAVSDHVDAGMGAPYQGQPLAKTWARVTKVASEAGEAIDALSAMTGENFRKGICGTEEELLGELGDAFSAAICAIQHITQDADRTWAVASAAIQKARSRVAVAREGQ
jgi:hypothetical protein